MLKLIFKILFWFILVFIILACACIFIYFKVLPFAVSNEKVISFSENLVNNYTNLYVDIEKPILVTKNFPKIEFKVISLSVSEAADRILYVSELDSQIDIRNILKKSIIIDRFGADNLFVDADKIMKLLPASKEKKETKSSFDIDLFDSILYLNNSTILYTPVKDTFIKLNASDLKIDNTQKIERYVHFNFNADIIKGGKTVKIAIKDDNKVVIKEKQIFVNNCPLIINYSKMFFNAWADRNKNFEVIVFAKRFFILDIIKLLRTNIIENNIDEQLAMIKDLHGDFDFKFRITNKDMTGDIVFNRISAKIIPLNNLPFKVSSGIVALKGNDLILKNFKGFYGSNKNNDFSFNGSVKDYLKTADTTIDMSAVLTNEFAQNYLSKVAGVSLSLVGDSRSKIIVKSKGNKFDITLMGKIAKGNDILLEGNSFSPVGYDRALKADLHLIGDNLNIETINYYIAKEITKASKGIKPILTLNGNVNIVSGKVYDFGFDIPNPLPSEFLNVIVGKKMFRKGKFSGNMQYVDLGKFPIIKANLEAEGVAIPSQRLFLKKGKVVTADKSLNIFAQGRFRRCQYDFKGKIGNAIIFPILVRNITLTLDNVDVERIMRAMNAPVQQADYTKEEIDDDDTNDALAFDIKNLIIEECIVKILNGKYKEINFSNIEANMSLDKNSIFKMHSNRFEIAEGHSSAEVNCDLKNQKYSIKLGIKDVNSDIMSTAILNLKREISGKASGYINLNTDESLKLNGVIKFVVKNGTIQKIGLVEYVLKFAALFRNPLAMISPSVFSDLINIPEGNFDKITGDLILKNNVIEMLKIKSYSPQLSAFIIGRYNLENSDAILRIYTKFSNKNKGFAGFLRNFSLNSLANRIPLNSRNDSNYYAAELSQLPAIDAEEKDCQVFLTKVDGDVEHNNFISSLKKIK